MTPSKYQQRIFDFIQHESGSAIIEAVAGSGKTTTIVDAVRLLPDQDYIFLAFNKSIAEELKARGVRASTFHALCFAELNSRLAKRPKVDSGKVRLLFNNLVSDEEKEEYYDLPKLVSLAKNSAFQCNESNEEWETLIEEHNLTFQNIDRAVRLADRLLCLSNDRLDIIDFDDMLYLPWLKNFSLRSYRTVFIDEAQDTNTLQLLLLRKLVDPFAGRLIAVGDQAQAIYGFRGAGTGSMAAMSKMFSCAELPLSISYRCPKLVVQEAQKYVPQIEAWDEASLGRVEYIPWPDSFPRGSAVLCRLNRPLVKLAFHLVSQGVSIRYLGRDLSKTLKGIVKRLGAGVNIETLLARVEVERDIEIEKAEKKGRGNAAYVEDLYDSLLAIIERLPGQDKASSANPHIDAIFKETPNASVTLTTVHKAKGMEWPVVFLLDANRYMPHPRTKEGWQLQQEYNMLYVAVTRAKQSLFFIETE